MRKLVAEAIHKKLVRGLGKSIKSEVDKPLKKIMELLSDEQLLSILQMEKEKL